MSGYFYAPPASPPPLASDLRKDVVVGAVTGTCAVPTAAQVLDGIDVDDTEGNVELPAVTDVRNDVDFGPGGGSTGSLDGYHIDDGSGLVGYYDEFTAYMWFPAFAWCSGWGDECDISSLTALKGYNFYGAACTKIKFPSTAPTVCENCGIQYCPLDSNDYLDFEDWTALEVLDCGDTVDGGRPNVAGCTALAQIGFYADTRALEGIDGLEDSVVDGCYSWAGVGVGMVAAEINNILIDLDATGVNNGYCDLTGSHAAPTGAGAAAKTSLQGKGWTVDTN